MSNERSYSPGWCTWWVAKTLPWIPAGLGNADTWPERAAAKGLRLTMTPYKGSAVCYAPGHGYSELGHVAVVTAVHPRGQFTVSEMAYTAWNVVDTRTSNLQDVAGFILPPGVQPAAVPPPPAPPPPVGINAARLAWAAWARFLTHTLPLDISAMAAAVARIRLGF